LDRHGGVRYLLQLLDAEVLDLGAGVGRSAGKVRPPLTELTPAAMRIYAR
jgi:hypothetical protein